GYWNFNEGAGNAVQDHSSYGNAGTMNDDGGVLAAGNVTWTSGARGNALDFTGANHPVAVIPNSASLSITDNITIKFWIYGKAWPNNFVNPMTKFGSTDNGNYSVYLFGNNAGAAPGTLVIDANAGGQWQGVSPQVVLPALNTWYHVAWTYGSHDGSTMYIN